jgi:ABC-2 type transport system permease protein
VEMLRPLPVLTVRLAAEVGRCTARLAVLLLPGATYAWIVVGPPPSTAGLVLALPALVLAVAVNLCLQYALAGAAFWLRDTRAMWFLYQKLVFILGGMLLPLEVLPGVLHDVAMTLPFMEPWLLLVQVGWLVMLAAGAAAVFAAGQRRLQVVGG